MNEKITVELLKDESGTPTQVVVKKRNRRLTAVFDKESGFNLVGDLSLAENLKMVYPFNEKTVLKIPEPLTVQSATGGSVLVFDDFEGILKWVSEGGAGIALSNAVQTMHNGSWSLSVNNDAADRYVPSCLNSFKYRCFFNSPLNAGTVLEWCYHRTFQTRMYSLELRYTLNTQVLSYRDLVGNYVQIEVLPLQASYWHLIEATIKDNLIESIRLDSAVFGINQQMYNVAAVATLSGLLVLTSTVATSFFDDVLVMELK